MLANRDLLKFMKSLTPELLPNLPIDGRTLRGHQIEHSWRKVPPGEMVYFGIQQMLEYGGSVLFDENCNQINLSLNMDGLPLSRAANSIGFWPILGSIEEYPVFVIGAYEGVQKPACANDYLYDLIKEVKRLQTRDPNTWPCV